MNFKKLKSSFLLFRIEAKIDTLNLLLVKLHCYAIQSYFTSYLGRGIYHLRYKMKENRRGIAIRRFDGDTLFRVLSLLLFDGAILLLSVNKSRRRRTCIAGVLVTFF